MVQISDKDIRRDHAHWLNDFATWNREIKQWQKQYDTALIELRRLYTTIAALKSAARGHADVINAYTVLCYHHAEATSNYSELKQCGAMAFIHDQLAARHDHIKETHERIRDHHRSVVFSFHLLESTDQQSEEGETCPTNQ